MQIDLTRLDDKTFADFAETLFEAEAKRRGLSTYRTTGENKEHDMLVENPTAGQIYKVQIKASRTPIKGTTDAYNIFLQHGGQGRNRTSIPRKKYSTEGVDVLAVVIPDAGSFYLIPRLCDPPKQIRVQPGSDRKYEKYLGLWNVFCIPMTEEFIHGILGGTCPPTCAECHRIRTS